MPLVTDTNDPALIDGGGRSAIAVLRNSAETLERLEEVISEPVRRHYRPMFDAISEEIGGKSANRYFHQTPIDFDTTSPWGLTPGEDTSLAAMMFLRSLVLSMAQRARDEADRLEDALTVYVK